MPNLTAVIIDDEPKACAFLNSILDKYCPDIYVIDCYTDPIEGVSKCKLLKPDVLFLDINMPGLDGFQVFSELKSSIKKLVFTTAYEQFALKAIKHGAFDYLLKPIDFRAVKECVTRISNDFQLQDQKINQGGHLTHYQDVIAIHDKGGLVFTEVSEIIMFEGDGGYTNVWLSSGKKLVSSKTINAFGAVLDPKNFLRVHRSYLVNVRYILRYEVREGGELILSNEKKVPVSRRKRQVLKDFSI